MDNGKKNIPKVLTTDDIRKHVRDWTLAGDVGLLAHLEQFSENIINKTQETQKNLIALVDEYEELYTKVGNITNQFLALQNCQFVENRVYDEETPTEEKAEVKVQDEVEQEKLLLIQYKEAVEIGIKLLDTHFHEVELPPSSDSDEDDELSPGNSVIWKPKNPYSNKKFPLLIGSAEWWADDKVGLKTNEISDIDKIMSESESDMESLKSVEKAMKSSSSTSMENITPIPSKPTFLASSSEDLFVFDKNKIQNNASDGFSKDTDSRLEEPASFLPDFEKESKKKRDSFHENQLHDEKPGQDETTTGTTKKVENAFTRELMAKLASVTNKNEESGKEKVEENNQENSPPTKTKTENLFDDVDASGDLFSAKINNKITEKLAGNKGLFDAGNDDELFRGEKDIFSENDLFKSHDLKKPESQPFEKNSLEVPEERKSFEKKETVTSKKNLVNHLFDDLEDDDELFAVKPQNRNSPDRSVQSTENSKIKKKNIIGSGLGWDSDEGLFDTINNEIDDDFFNSSGFVDKINKEESKIVGDSKSEDRMSNFLSEESNIDRKTDDGVGIKGSETSAFDANVTGMTTIKDAFDDSFGFSISKESNDLKISFLDSKDEDDLFSKSFKEEKKPAVKVMTLPDEDATALFAEKPKPANSVSVSSSRSSLFEDLSVSKSRLSSVFEKDKNNKLEDDLFNVVDDSFFANDEKDFFSSKEKEKTSLFDDCDDSDDLFGVTTNNHTKEGSFVKKYSEDSVKKTEEDIFKQSKQQVFEAKSFMDDLGDDDLFKTSDMPTKLRESKSDVVMPSEEKLFEDDLDDYDLFCDRAKTIKPKPPSTLSLRAKETESKNKTVGKLNIPSNLKIKFESAAKHISPECVNSPAEEKEEEVLNVNLQSSVLLKCPSKDRVKIPGRRRPQSRRARQEAIRNSETWDQLTSPGGSSNTSQPLKDPSSPLASYPLSPSTDEEDFFKVPELDTNFEKEDQSIFKSDLFESSESSKLDDNLLFDGAPVLSPLSPKTSEVPVEKHENWPKIPEADTLFGLRKSKTVSMFDSDDFEEDDENLFRTSGSTSEGSALFHPTAKEEEKVKKLLFESDFDDEEDDLFKGKSLKTPSKLPVVDKAKESGEAEDKRNSSFLDPLGLITKRNE